MKARDLTLYAGPVLLAKLAETPVKQKSCGVRIIKWAASIKLEGLPHKRVDHGVSMTGSRTILHLLTKASIGLGALFLVGVLLAAIPNHRVSVVGAFSSEGAQEAQQAPSTPMDHSKTPGTDMDDAKSSEHQAMQEMAGMGHGNRAHMYMTAPRAANAADQQRANEIAEKLRAGIEKYKDYQVALNEGFTIFMPELPQKEYHFTSYSNAFLQRVSFDPTRPTSLLYKKTATGYELVGAMYTMPKSATEDQLNERVPLSVATWHLHTNLCMPQKDRMATADWSKFGLRGSIATQEACDAAGGRFSPVVFGWMVHVYPYEGPSEKMFAMHHND
jgi:hypothetical protein